MLILVVNCGSSSLKFALLNPETGDTKLSGLAERLGSPEAVVKVKRENGEKATVPMSGGSYDQAFGVVMSELDALGVREEVGAVGHRTVHGAERFSSSVLITPEVMESLQACVPLAPLHNPANISGIQAAQAAFPNIPHVAVFDTAFHQTMPPVAYRYAVPDSWYSLFGVRRYGFHGTSHQYVSQEAAKMLGKPVEEVNIITAHLGNGASLAAIKGGKSVDTTMGMTPLEGLVMGTRSGDLDPGIHDYVANQTGKSLAEITTMLNKESGVLGISGVASDMREIEDKALEGHETCRLALDVYNHRLAKLIAGMAVSLGRVDALVFTGGVGENSDVVRREVLPMLEFMGFKIDEAKNKENIRGKAGPIHAEGSIPVLVINTNEELMIARDTQRLSQ